MPVDVRLIRAHEFVRRADGGTLDADASLALLVGAASGINVNRASQILLDLRQAEAELDVLALHALGARLAMHSSVNGRRVAVLAAANEDTSSARLAELVAGTRGSAARAFANLDDALAWLGGG
jgi:hypothetical protein